MDAIIFGAIMGQVLVGALRWIWGWGRRAPAYVYSCHICGHEERVITLQRVVALEQEHCKC